MKTVRIVPEACRGENPKFSGEVEMKVPTFDDKYEILEALGVEPTEEGLNLTETKEKFALIRKLVKISEKFYVSVELKNLESGAELKSYADLQEDGGADLILIEMAGKLMNGFKLGNSQ